MNAPKRCHCLRGWLLLAILWGGACTGVQERLDTTRHYYDKTEADLAYGRPEAAASYPRPRGVQRYGYDETELDLSRPRSLQQREEQHTSPPPSRSDALPATPLPDGGR
jgi:hypothetical protein